VEKKKKKRRNRDEEERRRIEINKKKKKRDRRGKIERKKRRRRRRTITRHSSSIGFPSRCYCKPPSAQQPHSLILSNLLPFSVPSSLVPLICMQNVSNSRSAANENN
jgi:hypothetical protein